MRDRLAALLGRPVTSGGAACAYLVELVEIGYAYHPDDGAADIVDAHGAPVFTDAEAALADARMCEVRAYLADPSLVLLPAWMRS